MKNYTPIAPRVWRDRQLVRILFITPYIPSRIRVRPYQFIRELSKNHEIALLAVDSSRSDDDLEHVQQFCASVDRIEFKRFEALQQVALGVGRLDPLQASAVHSARLDRTVKMLLTREKFDIVHVEHLRAARVGRLIPRSLPRVLDAVDSISLLWERTARASHSFQRRMLARLELPLTRRFEAKMTRWYDELILTSEIERLAFERLAPNAPITVIPNGVDLSYFTPQGGPRSTETIILSGKMSYHANATAAIHFARNIYPVVRARRPEVKFQIVGVDPSPEVRRLPEQIQGVEIIDQVQDLASWVARATVAVSPVTVKVGVQNKILEAMACGVPVVATPMGAEGINAEPNRELLIANSDAEFADHVDRVIGNRQLQDSLARAGRRYVEANHRWSEATSKLEHRYRAAIEDRRRTAGRDR